MEEEIILDNLRVELFGRMIKYDGVLSNWKMTLIGSMHQKIPGH